MTFDEWEAEVPSAIREDPLWRVEGYRLSLFLSDLCWHDATKLLQDDRTKGVCDQLYRAVGKISSNIGEGYSRGTAKARILYYEYALGSVREARDWYFKGRHVLGLKVAMHRIELTASIARLTLASIGHERRSRRRIEPREDSK
jgi:four helix bundle protein